MHVRLLCTVTWNGFKELNELLDVYNVIRTLHITTHRDQITTKEATFYFFLDTLSKSSYKSRPNVASMRM